jgi:predicted porin
MNPKHIAVAVGLAFLACGTAAHADQASELQSKLDALQKQMDAIRAEMSQMSAQIQKQKQEQKPEQQAKAASFIERKPGEDVTFVMGRSEVTLYGNLDISLDTTTKGLNSSYDPGGSPEGKVGWLPAISTNLSYLGVRGKHDLGDGLNLVYQLETQLDISATAGTVNTNSNNDTVVKGALTSRNSFIGLASSGVGAFKIGKTDAPYKTSTARMNPFSGKIGDYSVVMGNTGGDNRVEFGTRIDHAIWYESPNFSGFTVNALYAPGQNRSDDNSLIAAGESSCAGGNVPGSGALPPTCNDGSFGNALSASLAYQGGPIYVTAAYELHKKVNRTSDLPDLNPADVGDERAFKIGAQYTFPTRTTVSAIYEDMKRTIPAFLNDQNERTRKGYWFALTQPITAKDSFSFGWAHAGKTPGDPGQHNTTGGPNPDNEANMYTMDFRHSFDKWTAVYVDWAMTSNHHDAHYDLGAGGRAVTTDCHDGSALAAFDATANGGNGGVTGSGPHCFAGGRLQGVSVGLNYHF